MPKESYDPKLSQAGFMDLVCALQERLKTPDGTTTLATMPEVQRDAALRLGEAAKAYVDVVEGRADQSSDLMEKVVKALMTHKMVVMCDVEGDPEALVDFFGLNGVRPGVARDEINAIAETVCKAIA